MANYVYESCELDLKPPSYWLNSLKILLNLFAFTTQSLTIVSKSLINGFRYTFDSRSNKTAFQPQVVEKQLEDTNQETSFTELFRGIGKIGKPYNLVPYQGFGEDEIINAVRTFLKGYDVTVYGAITEEPHTPIREQTEEDNVETDGAAIRRQVVKPSICHYFDGRIRTSSFQDSPFIFPERTDEGAAGCRAKLVTRKRIVPFEVTIIAHGKRSEDVIFIFYEVNKALFVPYLREPFNEGDPVYCEYLEIPKNVSKKDIINIYLKKLFQSTDPIDSQERASEWQLGDGTHRIAYSNTEISKKTSQARAYWRAEGSDIVITSNNAFALSADILRLASNSRFPSRTFGFLTLLTTTLMALYFC